MENEPIMSKEQSKSDQLDSTVLLDKKPSQFGVIIGILITILALILMGLYIWSQTIVNTPLPIAPTPQRPTAAENNEPESTDAEARAEVLDIVSTSDELSAIEADLESTQIDGMETDLNAIDLEMNATLE